MAIYSLIVIVTAIITWLIMCYCFMTFVKDKSANNEPIKISGKTYFFMTQDQIQNAVKAIFLLEKSHEKLNRE